MIMVNIFNVLKYYNKFSGVLPAQFEQGNILTCHRLLGMLMIFNKAVSITPDSFVNVELSIKKLSDSTNFDEFFMAYSAVLIELQQLYEYRKKSRYIAQCMLDEMQLLTTKLLWLDRLANQQKGE